MFLVKTFLLHKMFIILIYIIDICQQNLAQFNINHFHIHAIFKTDSPLTKGCFYREYVDLCRFYYKIGHSSK